MTFLQGTVYGIFIQILFNVILLLALETAPAPWRQPFCRIFFEIFRPYTLGLKF
ncbi:hypothetical protein [Tetragenococcus halophilus]|uniref:hypothetical protein n=1 Tax=Tetragenococcus halophilus TaxID=51669 RepID=UPI0035A21FD7